MLFRSTGVGLYFAMLLLVAWLWSASSNSAHDHLMQLAFGNIAGQAFLFFVSWAAIHHLLGGLRHFVWDAGIGYGKSARDKLALSTLVGSVGITLLLWIL